MKGRDAFTIREVIRQFIRDNLEVRLTLEELQLEVDVLLDGESVAVDVVILDLPTQ